MCIGLSQGTYQGIGRFKRDGVSPGKVYWEWMHRVRTLLHGMSRTRLYYSIPEKMTDTSGEAMAKHGRRPLLKIILLTAAALTASGGLLFWAYFRVPRGELAHSASMDSTVGYDAYG